MCMKSLKVYSRVVSKTNPQSPQPTARVSNEALTEFKKQIQVEQAQIDEKQKLLAEKNNSAMKQELTRNEEYKNDDYYHSINHSENLEEKIDRYNTAFDYDLLLTNLNLKRLCNHPSFIHFEVVKRDKKKEPDENHKMPPKEEEQKLSFSIQPRPTKIIQKPKISFDDITYQLQPLTHK